MAENLECLFDIWVQLLSRYVTEIRADENRLASTMPAATAATVKSSASTMATATASTTGGAFTTGSAKPNAAAPIAGSGSGLLAAAIIAAMI
jgi:hypothetical protein